MSVVYFGRMDAAFLYPQNLLQWTDTMQGAIRCVPSKTSNTL